MLIQTGLWLRRDKTGWNFSLLVQSLKDLLGQCSYQLGVEGIALKLL
jgi:hypothetical protein